MYPSSSWGLMGLTSSARRADVVSGERLGGINESRAAVSEVGTVTWPDTGAMGHRPVGVWTDTEGIFRPTRADLGGVMGTVLIAGSRLRAILFLCLTIST